ncbi:MAG: hypothetical protein KKA60_06755 [Proteobacteria bacterium]|nr:hypothetical protein [Pseudomonadota bacterium]
MKRTLFWVAVIALLPLAAWAGMTAITDTELQDVKGQTGITIDMSVTMSAGDMAWEDKDGFTGAGATGAVILSGVTMPSVSLSGVIIDAGSTATTSYLQIDTGAGNLITGDFIINDLIIGDAIGATVESLGKFQISDTAISFGKIKISGH